MFYLVCYKELRWPLGNDLEKDSQELGTLLPQPTREEENAILIWGLWANEKGDYQQEVRVTWSINSATPLPLLQAKSLRTIPVLLENHASLLHNRQLKQGVSHQNEHLHLLDIWLSRWSFPFGSHQSILHGYFCQRQQAWGAPVP